MELKNKIIFKSIKMTKYEEGLVWGALEKTKLDKIVELGKTLGEKDDLNEEDEFVLEEIAT